MSRKKEKRFLNYLKELSITVQKRKNTDHEIRNDSNINYREELFMTEEISTGNMTKSHEPMACIEQPLRSERGKECVGEGSLGVDGIQSDLFFDLCRDRLYVAVVILHDEACAC